MLAFVFNPSEANFRRHTMRATTHLAISERVADRKVEDSALLHRIALCDQQAFELLYDRYATVLYSLCLAIVKRANDAEDVLQECFLQIWEKAAAFDGVKGSVYTWLVTLARNRAIDRLRSKHFQISRQQESGFDFDMLVSSDPSSPLDNASQAERAHDVRQAFGLLPREQRQVLQMAYFEGYSQSEIAEQLHIPLGTVKTRTRQAIKKLHVLLKKYVN